MDTIAGREELHRQLPSVVAFYDRCREVGNASVEKGAVVLIAEQLRRDHPRERESWRTLAQAAASGLLLPFTDIEGMEREKACERARGIAYRACVRAELDAEEEGPTGFDAPALHAVSLAEALTRHVPPRENVLAPWLPRQGLVMLYAARGVGKTYLALSVGLAAAAGGALLKWTAPQPRRVLFVDGEMAFSTMQERLAAITAGLDKAPSDPDYFRLLTPDFQEHGMPDLSTPDGQAAIDAHLRGVDLVVLDSISTLFRSGVENEAESWLPVQDWALALRRRGISVLFVHHAGKGGQQRGTSRREDVLDAVLVLKRPGDYHASEGARFEVHFEKARRLYDEDVVPFEAALMTEDDRLVWTQKSLEERTTEQVAGLINEGLSQREVAKQLGVGVGTVNRHAKRGREKGLISHAA